MATLRELPALNAPHSALSASQARVFANFTEDGKKLGYWRIRHAHDSLGNRNSKTTGKDERPHQHGLRGCLQRRWHSAHFGWTHTLGSPHRSWLAPHCCSLRKRHSACPALMENSSPHSCSNSNVITILEVPSGRQVQRLAPASGGGVVNRLSFSPDGTMLVTTYGPDPDQQQRTSTMNPGSNENQLKIWDVKSGRELRSIALGPGWCVKSRLQFRWSHLGHAWRDGPNFALGCAIGRPGFVT